MLLLDFEETRGWSSSESDGSDMSDCEREEAALIRTRFVPPSKGSNNNPTSENEDIQEELPYDMNLSDTEIMNGIVDRSHLLVKQLKGAGQQWSQLLGQFSHWETK